MSDIRLNAYRIMWLFVMFDLPTETRKNKKDAALFRKNLEKDGFGMCQYSVYLRFCASYESLQVHIKRVKGFIPESGTVNLLSITDKQYSEMITYRGCIEKKNGPHPLQLEIF